ncbi:MAG: dihydropteroate synthase [Puniceicoccaceae bacterium]
MSIGIPTSATPEPAPPVSLMGIINATPDSFSDGGLFDQPHLAAEHAESMVYEGAEVIDIGAESTRPGALPVDSKTEIARLLPVLQAVRSRVRVPISVDTSKAEVAAAAFDHGADWLNDVWGFQRDPLLPSVAATAGATVVLMHNQATTEYPNGLIEGILSSLGQSIEIARAAGLADHQIILDPGIGFGKTAEQNLLVLRHLKDFHQLGFPLLLGASRKSFIGKVLDLPVENRLEGTLAVSTLAVSSGVRYLRVHDITPNLRAVRVAEAVLRASPHG